MWDEKCGALTKNHVDTKTPRYHIDYIKKAIFQKAYMQYASKCLVVILTQMHFEV